MRICKLFNLNFRGGGGACRNCFFKTSLAFISQMVIVLSWRYPGGKCFWKFRKTSWTEHCFVYLHQTICLSSASLYKEYIISKHEDSLAPHTTCISHDFLRTVCSSHFTNNCPSIAYRVQVDDEPSDGFKDFLDSSNRAKCSEFHVTNCCSFHQHMQVYASPLPHITPFSLDCRICGEFFFLASLRHLVWKYLRKLDGCGHFLKLS